MVFDEGLVLANYCVVIGVLEKFDVPNYSPICYERFLTQDLSDNVYVLPYLSNCYKIYYSSMEFEPILLDGLS